MNKIAIWFDINDQEKEHFIFLKKAFELNCAVNIVQIKYRSRIGKLIINNFSLIYDFSFSNLEENLVVYYNEKKYKIKSRLRTGKKEILLEDFQGKQVIYQIGKFKTKEEFLYKIKIF
jgi:hypothetical protein